MEKEDGAGALEKHLIDAQKVIAMMCYSKQNICVHTPQKQYISVYATIYNRAKADPSQMFITWCLDKQDRMCPAKEYYLQKRTKY